LRYSNCPSVHKTNLRIATKANGRFDTPAARTRAV
jgi:hypothetical protein